MLPSKLAPTSTFEHNIYFVNGISKNWEGAHGQALYINSFLGSGWDVRIIHNRTTSVAGDSLELNYDYAWMNGLKFKSLCTTAIFSLLLNAFESNAPIGLIGSSGGTLKTKIALQAFASLGSAEKAYLKSKVQLVHLGCLVHRSEYAWLENSLHRYRQHVDRRDPFARVFSGEILPTMFFNVPQMEGNVVSRGMVAASKPAFSSTVLAVAAGLFHEQGVYHAIRNNYMAAGGLRHCEADTMFDVPAPPPVPKVSRIRLRLKTGSGAGTRDQVTATIAGQKILCVDSDDGKLNGNSVHWFYQSTSSPVPISSIDRITIQKPGSDDWKLKGLTIQADTDMGLRTIYENASLNYWYTGNTTKTFFF